MIRHRQDSEEAISRPTLASGAVLATPPSHATTSGLRRFVRMTLGRIDRVATPALAGTTVAWATVALALQVMPAPGPKPWILGTNELLWAYCTALLLSIPLSALRARWHGWYAALTTWTATWVGLSISFGHYQFSRSPWAEQGYVVDRFIGQGTREMALFALFTAIVWLPVVLAVHHWRRPLAERIAEEKDHG